VTRAPRFLLVSGVLLIGVWLTLPTLAILPVSLNPRRSLVVTFSDWSGQWYQRFFDDPRWLDALTNSLVVALCASALATTLGTLAAFGLLRLPPTAQRVLGGLLAAPIVVPVILLGVGIYYVYLRWDLAGTTSGLVVAHAVTAIPLVSQPVLATLQRLDPNLERAAASLGASAVARFVQVTLPVISPGVLAGALFAFIWSFDEVVMAVFLTSPRNQTLPVLMFNSVTQSVDPTVAAASILVLLCSTVLVVAALALLRKGANRG
jgi:putative spermidine/putrescine transport system permease protein